MPGKYVFRPPLPAPPGPSCNWWIAGVLDIDGSVLEARNLVVPETRVGDAVTAARWIMDALEANHVVITTGEPDHETLYEERAGQVLVDRLGGGGGR
jgi:hypothetical protein